MSIRLLPVSGSIVTMIITGQLKQAELAKAQQLAEDYIDKSGKIQLLSVVENFKEWESGGDWDDLDFQLAHGDDITRIAVVDEPRWEEKGLAFTGAGFRQTKIKNFSVGQETQTLAWLGENE